MLLRPELNRKDAKTHRKRLVAVAALVFSLGIAASGQAQGKRQTTEQPRQPQPPFRLSRDEQAAIDQLLLAWEKQSQKVTTFECEFIRWEYDRAFGPKDKKGFDLPMAKCWGEIKYLRPDRGSFRVDTTHVWNSAKSLLEKKSGVPDENWYCDGQSIYEISTSQKQVIERRLPPELQGKSISDGPLPFLFGAKAESMKQRYYVRETTKPEYRGKEVWLEAFPRWQRDAANYKRLELILSLDRGEFRPFALRVYQPNDDYAVYEFKNVVVNNSKLTESQFQRPEKLPQDWKFVPDRGDQAVSPKARK